MSGQGQSQGQGQLPANLTKEQVAQILQVLSPFVSPHVPGAIAIVRHDH